MKRKICIATGTRADWGLLSGIARALNDRNDVDLQIIATNMHLSDRYGATWHEIERDGLRITRRVPMTVDTDTPLGTVTAMSECMAGMAQAFNELRPDLLIILGDRYEMLATASAALIFRIPIAHIATHSPYRRRGSQPRSLRRKHTPFHNKNEPHPPDGNRRIPPEGDTIGRKSGTRDKHRRNRCLQHNAHGLYSARRA